MSEETETKHCGGCQRDLPLDAFSFRSKKTGRRQARCKECVSNYNSQHHAATKETVNPRIHERKKARAAAGREAVRAFKAQTGCARCGERDPDRLAVTGAAGIVSHLVSGGYSQERLNQMLADGTVLCQSCQHRRHPLPGAA